MTILQPDSSRHPCFSPEAHRSFGRVHLPVAAGCNVQCGFCDRKYSCVNESRPGVTARLLSPEEAVDAALRAVAHMPHLSVIGIAGPGDPLADATRTLDTLATLREALPAMGRKIKGYDMPEALLTGVETRTSSPLRIDRGEDFQSLNTPGLFPAGEGAGYAGGILSAGVDGIKVGEAVARSLLGG